MTRLEKRRGRQDRRIFIVSDDNEGSALAFSSPFGFGEGLKKNTQGFFICGVTVKFPSARESGMSAVPGFMNF